MPYDLDSIDYNIVRELAADARLSFAELGRRVGLSPSAVAERVRQWATQTTDTRGRRVIDYEWVRVNLARVHAKTEFLKLINWKVASEVGRGVTPGEASATKVFGTELYCEAYRLLMEVLGTAATLRTDTPGALLRGRIERMHRSCLILTFGGGTNEIQRDIIGMVALGLPRVNR